MRAYRILLGLVLGLAAVAAVAQSYGTLRWRAGATPLGLQPSASDLPGQCGPLSLSCATQAILPLYTSPVAPRSVSMQLGTVPASAALKGSGAPGLSLNVVGRAGILSDLGIYGRVGATLARGSALAPVAGVDGMNYGVGVSWDFSRSGSAILGFDSYDVRSLTGETRDVRATSLGLQWRY